VAKQETQHPAVAHDYITGQPRQICVIRRQVDLEGGALFESCILDRITQTYPQMILNSRHRLLNRGYIQPKVSFSFDFIVL